MACDRCRRMRIKCDDARPICNTCTKRRKQHECTYYGGGGRSRGRPPNDDVAERPPRPSISSPWDPSREPVPIRDSPPSGPVMSDETTPAGRVESLTNDRIERLVEAKVQQLLARSNPLPSTNHPAALDPPPRAIVETSIAASSVAKPPATSEELWGSYEGICRLQNDGQTKSELYAIYCQRLHCQPLPLFDKNQLRHALDTCPKHLFSALYLATCRYSSRPHYPYHHFKGLIKTLWNVVASTDTKGLDVVQVYCVLALTFIWIGDRTSAQISTSSAAIVFDEITTQSSRRPSNQEREDDVLRACQSILILKCMIGRTGSSFDQPRTLPARLMPRSGDTAHAGHGASQPHDLGIVAYTVHLFSIFSRAISFVQSFGTETTTEHWRAQSTYNSIIQELLEFETTLAQGHRVRRLGLEQRSSSDLEHRRLYWAPWFMMQFLFHGIQALVNHPLMHLVDQRQDTAFRPPSFLQHTADQARLHAGWVVHLVKAAEDKSFELHDPFIAFIVATTATVFLFWLFDKDRVVANESLASFQTCFDYFSSQVDGESHLLSTRTRLEMLKQSSTAVADGRNPHPRPSAALEVLLPVFEYCKTGPVDRYLDGDRSVPLPIDTDFLTSPNAISAAATPNENHAPGNNQNGTDTNHTSHDADMVNGYDDFGNFNIFDTSDILNTTLLDGSLWPGQL